MTSSDESDEEVMDCTPPHLRKEANLAMGNMLPAKSKQLYIKTYDAFINWRKETRTSSFSENVFLAYFSQAAKNKKPSTLWAMYSMLRCTVQLKHGINIKEYKNLNSLLKRQSAGYKSKKSKIFTGENISKFLSEAPDDRFLAIKVALVLGINGACRCLELTNISVNDVEHHNNMILVKLRDTKTKIDRMFVVRDESVTIVQKYEALRPVDTNTDRFFVNYKNGKCTRQPIGRHTVASMPKAIATFLNLPNIDSYTGHCFRRSSATLLADSGANLMTLKRHGGWRSDQVAEGYIEDSIENKSCISKQINNSIQLKSSTTPLLSPQPSTSSQREQINSLQPSTSRQREHINSPQPSTSRQREQINSPQPSTSRQREQINSPQPSTSRQREQINSPQPSTSRQREQINSPQPSTSRQREQINSPQPLASQEGSLPPPNPMPSQVNTSQLNTQSTNPSSSILQNNINVPGKTIHFTFKNCPNMSNITFNIN